MDESPEMDYKIDDFYQSSNPEINSHLLADKQRLCLGKAQL